MAPTVNIGNVDYTIKVYPTNMQDVLTSIVTLRLQASEIMFSAKGQGSVTLRSLLHKLRAELDEFADRIAAYIVVAGEGFPVFDPDVYDTFPQVFVSDRSVRVGAGMVTESMNATIDLLDDLVLADSDDPAKDRIVVELYELLSMRLWELATEEL